jgi:hypothetical protein
MPNRMNNPARFTLVPSGVITGFYLATENAEILSWESLARERLRCLRMTKLVLGVGSDRDSLRGLNLVFCLPRAYALG